MCERKTNKVFVFTTENWLFSRRLSENEILMNEKLLFSCHHSLCATLSRATTFFVPFSPFPHYFMILIWIMEALIAVLKSHTLANIVVAPCECARSNENLLIFPNVIINPPYACKSRERRRLAEWEYLSIIKLQIVDTRTIKHEKRRKTFPINYFPYPKHRSISADKMRLILIAEIF